MPGLTTPRPQADSASEADGSDELRARRLSDPRSIRALAHPIRLALLQQLVLEDQLTATAAARLVGVSPSSCSFHFRQLAKYGFVEPAPGGRGRDRPWRACQLAFAFETSEGGAEPEFAADKLLGLFFGQELDRVRVSLEARTAYPAAWKEALPLRQTLLFVTAAELAEWGEALEAVWHRFDARLVDRTLRPPGAHPIEILLLGYPLSPLAGEAAAPKNKPEPSSGPNPGRKEG